MADDEVRFTIADPGLAAMPTLFELMREEGVQVVSTTRPRVDRDPAAPRNSPFVAVLQGAESAVEAAMARFRQVSDAQVEKLPPDCRQSTHGGTAALEAEIAALRHRQIEAPVHQHIHLHGVRPEDVAVIIQKEIPQ